MSKTTKYILKIILVLAIIAMFVLSYIDVSGLLGRSPNPAPEFQNPITPPSAKGPTENPPLEALY